MSDTFLMFPGLGAIIFSETTAFLIVFLKNLTIELDISLAALSLTFFLTSPENESAISLLKLRIFSIDEDFFLVVQIADTSALVSG